MKKDLTELVFILDRSGSMSGSEGDVIGGFNSLISKQRRERGTALVTTVLFDDDCIVLHDRMDVREVPPLTERDYYARGCTALLDAVGGTIERTADSRRHTCSEDLPERTLFVIMTDGMENASRHYSWRQVKQMIESRKAEPGWEFLFLGANIDAAAAAAEIGIPEDRSADYLCDGRGISVCYDAIDEAVTSARACEPLGGIWKEKITADFRRRGKKRR